MLRLLVLSLAVAFVRCSPPVCGRSTIPPVLEAQDRILGGTEAVPGSWPWMAGLRDHPFLGGEHFCAGTLIDEQHVLTASHCVRHLEFMAMVRVHLGSHRRETEDITEVSAKVAHICKHRLSYRTTNDIAIIKLKQKVPLSDYIRPVCLPEATTEDLPENSTVYAVGWGKTTADEEGPLSDVLKQLETQTMSQEGCQEQLTQKLLDTTLCTRHVFGSTCHGDSGGPLVRQTGNDTWVLEGVLAGGPRECGRTDKPMRFTKVSRFVPWIQEYLRRKTPAELKEFCQL